MAKFTILAAALLATVASAMPATLKHRACGSYDAPDYMVSLNKLHQSEAGNPGTTFTLAQYGSGGARSAWVSQVVSFNGPVGAYGCSIGLAFPEDIAAFNAATGLAGKPAPIVNVYQLATPIEGSAVTYGDVAAKKGALFGTAVIKPGVTTINSRSCPTTAEGGMGFLFEIADWITENTGVAWENRIDTSNIASSVGVFVNYNC